jgi:hypothetical protein
LAVAADFLAFLVVLGPGVDVDGVADEEKEGVALVLRVMPFFLGGFELVLAAEVDALDEGGGCLGVDWMSEGVLAVLLGWWRLLFSLSLILIVDFEGVAIFGHWIGPTRKRVEEGVGRETPRGQSHPSSLSIDRNHSHLDRWLLAVLSS